MPRGVYDRKNNHTNKGKHWKLSEEQRRLGEKSSNWKGGITLINHLTRVSMKFRICKRCSKIYIPTSGRQEYCKECIPIVKKECDEKRYLKNKEKINEHDKQWRKNNPEKYRESYKHWQEVHPDEWKILMARHRDKRERNLGYIPLNKFFEGSEGHHLDRDYVIYIPTEVHHSIYHSVLKDINMDEINAVAFNYL